MTWTAPKLTYANVMSTVALFATLGGGAYAASKFVGAGGVVKLCVSNNGGVKVLAAKKSRCGKGATLVPINQTGPAGRQGPPGTGGGTTYTAGSGLMLSGNSFGADPDQAPGADHRVGVRKRPGIAVGGAGSGRRRVRACMRSRPWRALIKAPPTWSCRRATGRCRGDHGWPRRILNEDDLPADGQQRLRARYGQSGCGVDQAPPCPSWPQRAPVPAAGRVSR